MKKAKKQLALVLAAVMAFGLLATTAGAAEVAPSQDVISEECLPAPGFITYKMLHGEEYDNPVEALLNDASARAYACYIPYNDGSGTSGQIAATFTAETSTVAFVLTSLGGGSNYAAALWKDNGSLPPSLVADYGEYGFGTGFVQSGLTVGQNYFIKISSQTVPSPGVNGRYELYWY